MSYLQSLDDSQLEKICEKTGQYKDFLSKLLRKNPDERDIKKALQELDKTDVCNRNIEKAHKTYTPQTDDVINEITI